MARLKIGTPEYDTAFGSAVLSKIEEYKSRMPTHQELQNAWCDPSLRTALGLDSQNSILGRKTQDIQHAAQAIFYDMSADLGTQAGKLASLPTSALSGLTQVMNSIPAANSMSDIDVTDMFSGNKSKAGKAVANLALGVGLVAVGQSVPLVGQIGAICVFIGKAIYNVIHKQKVQLDRQKAEVREALWQSFPDLQTADSVTDAGQVQYGVRAVVTSQDWTPVVLPRFDGEEFVGLERQKGFAFAPGKTTKWSDEFGKDVQAFQVGRGLGLIPGTNVLTSVIQVNLDPRGNAVQSFLRSGLGDPRGGITATNPMSGSRYVIDTGVFYEATRNACSIVYEQGQVKGSPLMYRFNAVEMDRAWFKYINAGIQFIKNRVLPWFSTYGKYKYDGRLDELNLEGFFGSAVYYAVGAWACNLTGGTTFHPQLTKYNPPSGWARDAMTSTGLYPESVYSGAFLPIQNPYEWWTRCLGDIYYRGPNVQKTIADFRNVQRWCLRHTMVCAYVRETDAAFKDDPDLLAILRKSRKALLESRETCKIVTSFDVPEEERFNGDDWMSQLLKAGMPKVPNKFNLPLGKLSFEPDDGSDPEPERPTPQFGDLAPAAWADPGSPAPPFGLKRWWPAGVGAAGTLFGVGWLMSRYKNRKTGPK